ncbi:MAG TPA: CocE/NonD family hydrolase [Steroidobacteraceae bacterium]|nr:CocE/NonD family hydrolase [Steroidobacteraceae bacterium]
MVRAAALALALIPAALALGATAAPPAQVQVGPGYDIEMSRMIPMRDGVNLEAWLFKPPHLDTKAPAVLELTQYDIDGGRDQDFKTFVRRGYVFVQVEVRGRGRSGGEKSDNIGLQVSRDGRDAVEWIARQPWSDGHVFMYGGSFVGMTQWHTATQLPPHLSGIAPYVPIYPGWDVPNTNGIPQAWSAVILGYVSGRTLNDDYIRSDYWQQKMLQHYARQQPFGTLDEDIGIAQDDWWMEDSHGRKLSFMKMWLDHVGDEAFNLAAEPKPAEIARMRFPVLTATGFFDDDQPGALHYYRRFLQYAAPQEAANILLVIGPWDHLGTQHPQKTIEGLTIPDSAVLDMNRLHADWYDWVLGRGPRPALLRDRVTYYMMGANEWRYAHSLDGASVGTLPLYLEDRAGTPQDLFHSGALLQSKPGAEPPATIVDDPRTLPELAVAQYAADEDLLSQFRAYEKDALVFHSAPLQHDTEVAGHMHLNLIVQSDAPDFDLWAQVQMIEPDGSAVTLGQDMRRARFRDGFFRQKLLKPGQVVTIPFTFNWMAWRIPAGARIRLVVMPLNSPDYQKNYNTGGRIGYEDPRNARVAHLELFHDGSRASALLLPLAAPAPRR